MRPKNWLWSQWSRAGCVWNRFCKISSPGSQIGWFFPRLLFHVISALKSLLSFILSYLPCFRECSSYSANILWNLMVLECPVRGADELRLTWLSLLLLPLAQGHSPFHGPACSSSYISTLFQCPCFHCSFPFNFHAFRTLKALSLCCREWDGGEGLDCGSVHIWIPLQAVLGWSLRAWDPPQF